VPHQYVRPLRNGRAGKATAAFGGCNDKLCNGGHRGDFWDSGLVTTEPDAADLELGFDAELFHGAAGRAAFGAADAARVSRHRPERDHGRGLSRRVGTRERLPTSTVVVAQWSWKRCPCARVRRLDNELAFTRERREPKHNRARGAAGGRVPHQDVRPLRNGRAGKATAAFGGCNDKLCNGGHRGDFWDSGLVTTEPDAADLELGFDAELFHGAAGRAAFGAADAARVSRHRPERDHGRGLSRRVGTRERLPTSTVVVAQWSWKRCPCARVRRLDNEFALSSERRRTS
jgi:hypothetical protein